MSGMFCLSFDIFLRKFMILFGFSIEGDKLPPYFDDSVFIDDNPTEIMSILDRKPKKVIRIQRKRSLYSDVVMDLDLLSYNSLNDIIENNILN